jgi:hypothetical protein
LNGAGIGAAALLPPGMCRYFDKGQYKVLWVRLTAIEAFDR